jgi:hypothetical protein
MVRKCSTHVRNEMCMQNYNFVSCKLIDLSTHAVFRLALVPMQPFVQWVLRAIPPSPQVKRLGHDSDHSPPSRHEIVEKVELYCHIPIHLHGMVLNYLGFRFLGR